MSHETRYSKIHDRYSVLQRHEFYALPVTDKRRRSIKETLLDVDVEQINRFRIIVASNV